MLPAGAQPPPELVHSAFVATPLTAELVDLDLAAYLASPDVIRVHSDGRWPVDGFTREQDAKLIARHEADHRAGTAFTFVLLDPARSTGLGCLYLNPLRSDDRTPRVTFWIRQDRQDTDLPYEVVRATDTWLANDWPTTSHVFRILPAERASRAALERAGLRQVSVRQPEQETRLYLYYRRP
ncbi:GNAT family N-acetyltransferase [Flindersiella endophytica]